MKIPFHIISGFLGSGKTTLLKRVIEKYSDQCKLGIIQNEFAPANIDGVELKKTGRNFHLLEINNGSVFCVCLLGDFIRSLELFIDEYHPDAIIIEASGLSDTTSVTEMISSGKLGEKLFLASNWCIVDAPNFFKTGMMKHRVDQQIRMADIILINKKDLIMDHNITGIIRKLNPFAKVIETVYCDVDFKLGNDAIPKMYMDYNSTMSRPEINSMVIKSGRKMNRENLGSFLKEWAPRAYRIKGFMNIRDGNTLSVQCTFGAIELIRSVDYCGPSELIALTDNFTLREWNRSFRQYL